MKLVQIKEGTTDLIVPKSSITHFKGPSTSKMVVFFNPVMEFSRDTSVSILSEFVKRRKARLLDGLAGTGARGVRIGNEVKGNFHIVINDHNPVAMELIEKNIAINSLKNCKAENKKINTLLSEEDFDYIDIDPFGSPVQFLDAALQSVRGDGMIALTATDAAPLCGTYQKTCERRYGARPIKTSYSHETAARILAGYCVRLAAKYDIALKPLLVFSVDHYIRAHFDVKKGAKKADNALKKVGYLLHNHKTGERKVIIGFPGRIDSEDVSGPLWIGNLHDRSFLRKVEPNKKVGTANRLERCLELWLEEANAPPFFYDMNEISSITRLSALPIRTMIERLRGSGFFASRTHFSSNGFKTDAGIEEIKAFVQEK